MNDTATALRLAREGDEIAMTQRKIENELNVVHTEDEDATLHVNIAPYIQEMAQGDRLVEAQMHAFVESALSEKRMVVF